MNAIIGLCHFCEFCGPSIIFTTQTLRETKITDIDFNTIAGKSTKCSACKSIGDRTGYLSKNSEGNSYFLSTQQPVIADLATIVKQAAVRSLSCEVSANKDGGFVFFGDGIRGHTLSHTFNVRDSEARGFFKLYSIIILMKDKMFLLNLHPFLSKNLQEISREIQNYANRVYENEQLQCSQRAQRLNSGQVSAPEARSLNQLTAEPHIFAEIHSHFAWLLWAGSRYFTETVTIGCPLLQSPNKEPPSPASVTTNDMFLSSSMRVVDREYLLRKFGLLNGNHSMDSDGGLDDDEAFNLRKCKKILRSDFVPACYCAIVGIQIVLRGRSDTAEDFVKCFRQLLPDQMHTMTRIDSSKYLPTNACKILGIPSSVAVPQPSTKIFRIDLLGDDLVSVKWLGEVPNKWPSLLVKVIKAVNETLFTDLVLEKHLRVLVEEWKNKIQCIQKITSSHDVNNLKKILGIQPQDDEMVDYWINLI